MPGSKTQAAPNPDAPAASRRICLGRVGGVHGLKGRLKLISYTDPREGIFDYRPLLIGGRAFENFEGKVQGKGLVIHLQGLDDRTAVEGLVGCDIEVERCQLPELDAGQYYWTDLEGLAVVDDHGQSLGRVKRIMPTGANPVLVVSGDRELLIPWVDGTYVLDIDLENQRIVVDWDPDWV